MTPDASPFPNETADGINTRRRMTAKRIRPGAKLRSRSKTRESSRLGRFRNGEHFKRASRNDGLAPPSQMDSPPSTTSACPVMNDDMSDARNKTELAISSAVPQRPNGMLLEM